MWCHVSWLEWKSGFWGLKEQQLSLLPCQIASLSYDPGESVFLCVFLSLKLTFSLYKHILYLSLFNFSLSIYTFVCPFLVFSLSSNLSHLSVLYPSSLCPNSSFAPFSSFFQSHAIHLLIAVWSINTIGMLLNFSCLLVILADSGVFLVV